MFQAIVLSRQAVKWAIAATIIFFIVVLTLSPYEFKPLQGHSVLDEISLRWIAGDFYANIAFTVPLGFILASIFIARRGYLWGLVFALLASVLVSLAVEVLQIFLPRTAAVYDVLSNSVGAVFGTGFYLLLRKPLAALIRLVSRYAFFSWLILLAFCAYFVFFLFVVTSSVPLKADFSNWNGSYSLLLAGDRNGSDLWTGSLYQTAYYGNVKSKRWIDNRFEKANGKSQAISNDAILYYDFNAAQGDVIANKAPVYANSPNLKIQPIAAVSWLSPSGLAVNADAQISANRAYHLFKTVKLAPIKGFTLELWLQASQLDSDNIRPIVSYSAGPHIRNFSLGQQGADLVFRLRTPLTGINGDQLLTRASKTLKANSIQHVVVLATPKRVRIFVDGVQQADQNLAVLKRSPLERWQDQRVAAKYRYAYWTMLFIPLGVLGLLLSQQGETLFLSCKPFLLSSGVYSVFLLQHVMTLSRWPELGLMLLTYVSVMLSTVCVWWIVGLSRRSDDGQQREG